MKDDFPMSDISNLPQTTQSKDYPYFRRLWNTTVMTLLAASFIPYLFIGGVIYVYTASVLKEKTLGILQSEVVLQKTAIDRFLAERTRELQLIARNLSLAHLSQPGILNEIFNALSQESPYFIDLGVIDDHGRQVAYAGPYDLLSKNYQTSDWYIDTLAHDVYISDIFLGFRNIPHSVIAVKYSSNEGRWILRATIDGRSFDNIVKEISYPQKGDAYLINRNGMYQTTPRKFGKVMAQSEIKGIEHHEGVKLEAYDDHLRLSVWLEKVPWISVVEMNKKEAFASLYRVRNLVIYIFVLSSIIMIFAILLTTNYLITRLESKRKSIRHLDHQLRHTSRIATAAVLSTGVFHKVKDCLANIDITTQCMGESPGNESAAHSRGETFDDNLKQIHMQLHTARHTIDTYLRLADSSGPVIRDIQINELLRDLMELLDWEFQNKHATIVKELDAAVGVFRSDPTSVRHILQSLIHNAIEAISEYGRITVQTCSEKEGVRVIVSDNGPGISEADRQRVFEPLFSTKARNLGLGLSVSKSIVEKLGGTISVESAAGSGAAFSVFFPYQLERLSE
jgi:two-component system NtrC family sensor kinase